MSRFQLYIAASRDVSSLPEELYGVGLDKVAARMPSGLGPPTAVERLIGAAERAGAGAKNIFGKGKAIHDEVSPLIDTASKAVDVASKAGRGAVNLTTPSASRMLAEEMPMSPNIARRYLDILTGQDVRAAKAVERRLGGLQQGWRRFLPGASDALSYEQEVARRAGQTARLKQLAALSPVVGAGAVGGSAVLNATSPRRSEVQPYPVQQIYGR